MNNINIQVRVKKGYTLIWQDINQDLRLSNKDLGLLVRLLGLPPNWRFSETGLCERFQIGKYELRTGLKKLEACGYLEREQLRSKGGKYSYTKWTVYDFSKNKDCSPLSGFRTSDNPKADKPKTDKPGTENQPQLITNELNTNGLNTNISHYSSQQKNDRNTSLFYCDLKYTYNGVIDENCENCYRINACPFPCRQPLISELNNPEFVTAQENRDLVDFIFYRNPYYNRQERKMNNILTDEEKRYGDVGEIDTNGCLQE